MAKGVERESASLAFGVAADPLGIMAGFFTQASLCKQLGKPTANLSDLASPYNDRMRSGVNGTSSRAGCSSESMCARNDAPSGIIKCFPVF
jgi:hypothetical protein